MGSSVSEWNVGRVDVERKAHVSDCSRNKDLLELTSDADFARPDRCSCVLRRGDKSWEAASTRTVALKTVDEARWGGMSAVTRADTRRVSTHWCARFWSAAVDMVHGAFAAGCQRWGDTMRCRWRGVFVGSEGGDVGMSRMEDRREDDKDEWRDDESGRL